MVIKSADQQPRLNLGEDISYYAFFFQICSLNYRKQFLVCTSNLALASKSVFVS